MTDGARSEEVDDEVRGAAKVFLCAVAALALLFEGAWIAQRWEHDPPPIARWVATHMVRRHGCRDVRRDASLVEASAYLYRVDHPDACPTLHDLYADRLLSLRHPLQDRYVISCTPKLVTVEDLDAPPGCPELTSRGP